jgi:hypothetical protein
MLKFESPIGYYYQQQFGGVGSRHVPIDRTLPVFTKASIAFQVEA